MVSLEKLELYMCSFKRWEAKEEAVMMLIYRTVIVNQASCNWLLNMHDVFINFVALLCLRKH